MADGSGPTGPGSSDVGGTGKGPTVAPAYGGGPKGTRWIRKATAGVIGGSQPRLEPEVMFLSRASMAKDSGPIVAICSYSCHFFST